MPLRQQAIDSAGFATLASGKCSRPTRVAASAVLSLLVVAICLGTAERLHADWPQWGGASRDFKVDGVDLLESWPDDGLTRLWSRPLGDGYAGIAELDGTLYTMYRQDDHETVIALSAAEGHTIWEHRYPAPFLPDTDLQPGPGPHATPLVVGGRICTVGVTGILHCLDAQRGGVAWRHDLVHDFGGTVLFRGYSSSPIAYGSCVIVMVGGPGHAVMALDIEDGSVAWQSQDFGTSHVSPLLIQLEGQDQLVVIGSEVVAGLDPADGRLLWQHAQPMTGGHIASMPVSGDDGLLFFSAAYGGGSRCLKLSRGGEGTTVEEIWHTPRMQVHHSNAIRVGDHVYGSSGDFGPKLMAALNVNTGELAWRDRRLTRASSLYVDGKFIALEEDGHLSLATMTPERLTIHSRVQLFDAQAWTAPTLIGHRLYVRNRQEIMAFEVP